jgi:hypothetical protein
MVQVHLCELLHWAIGICCRGCTGSTFFWQCFCKSTLVYQLTMPCDACTNLAMLYSVMQGSVNFSVLPHLVTTYFALTHHIVAALILQHGSERTVCAWVIQLSWNPN